MGSFCTVDKSSSKEKLKKKASVEKKGKHNKSVVSGDDSLQEINAKDIDQILSPVKSRKVTASYKRQSVKNPDVRNSLVADLQPDRGMYEEVMTPANPGKPCIMYGRQQHIGNSEPKNTFVEANQGRSQIYPSTSDEIRKWYTSPQSNADYYNSPMHVNVYENIPTRREQNDTPFYTHVPVNQTGNLDRPITELKRNAGEFESMVSDSGGSPLPSTDMGDFKLIHKSLTPGRSTIRRYPNKDTPQDIPDEPISEEKNMSNINEETEKYCHPTDICGKQSLKLNLKDMEHSSQGKLHESDIALNKDTEILFHRFKRQSNADRDPFDCVLDFDFSRNIASKIKEQQKGYVVRKMMNKSAKEHDQQGAQLRNMPPTPPSQMVQSSLSPSQYKVTSPHTQMANAVQIERLKNDIVTRNQQNFSSFTEQNLMKNDDNKVDLKELAEKEDVPGKNKDKSDLDTSINDTENQDSNATQDTSNGNS